MPLLTWTELADRLAPAHSYWVHTTSQAGAPHASPVWGVVVDRILYHYTSSSTLKAQDLRHDPRAVVHLESASEVLIVRGRLQLVGRPGEHPEVVAAFDRKYTAPDEVPFLPSQDPAFDVLLRLEPTSALTWSLPDTEASTRRWASDTTQAASGKRLA